MEAPSEYSYYSEDVKEHRAPAVAPGELAAAAGAAAQARVEARYEQDVWDLYAKYAAISKEAAAKTQKKYGLLNRVGCDPERFSQLSEAMKKLELKKSMLVECVPTKINKMAQEAELAYRRLMDVNSNILPTDYGQGVYDDICVHNRHHKRHGDAGADDDEYEAEIAQGLALFNKDKRFLEEMRHRSMETVNPVEKI